VKVLREGALPPLEIELFDYDYLSRNDLLGSVKVDWSACVKKPTTWCINRYEDLKVDEAYLKKNPDIKSKIYIALNFIPEGEYDPLEELKDLDNPGQTLTLISPNGVLFLRLICLKDMKYIKNDVVQSESKP